MPAPERIKTSRSKISYSNEHECERCQSRITDEELKVQKKPKVLTKKVLILVPLIIILTLLVGQQLLVYFEPDPEIEGGPLQIIEVKDEKLVFKRKNLEEVLSKCGDLPLVVYSIAGQFRKGKSFLLNLFLLFNYYNRRNQDWTTKNAPIKGFDVKGGRKRVTTGLWIWSEPVIVTDDNGRQGAIILMDSQGTFDTVTTSKINSFVLGFSISVSSVMIYNVKDNISEKDLDDLVAFAECFKEVYDKFQGVKFLVRDWINDDELPYGSEGGGQFVSNILELKDVKNKQATKQLNRTRTALERLFSDVSGFLLPPPGDTVAGGKADVIRLKSVDVKFMKYMNELCQDLFKKQLHLKEDKGHLWNADVFLSAFDEIKDANLHGRIIDPGTVRESHARALAYASSKHALRSYQDQMEKSIDKMQGNKNFLDEVVLFQLDRIIRKEVLSEFRSKFSDPDVVEDIANTLEGYIEKWYRKVFKLNDQLKQKSASETDTRRLNDIIRESRQGTASHISLPSMFTALFPLVAARFII